MIQVGVLGATGYTARVLLQLLAQHPQAEVTVLASRREHAHEVSDFHPQLDGVFDLQIVPRSPTEVAEQVDCLFSCLPHAASAAALADVPTDEVKVIDLSADYRLWDADLYAEHYDGQHPFPDRLGRVPYGLPELYRERIRGSNFVANPGCYPTSAILAMAPFLRAGVAQPERIIFDSKSGVTGAGRKLSDATHFAECHESIAAYKVGQHRHTPEIGQILGDVAGATIRPLFTPHLVPMDRGILTAGYAALDRTISTEEAIDILREAYEGEPFVRVLGRLPATKHTVGTNFCDITARVVDGQLVTISCIDNLVKGASGAAVQNMNLMYGWDETMALSPAGGRT